MLCVVGDIFRGRAGVLAPYLDEAVKGMEKRQSVLGEK